MIVQRYNYTPCDRTTIDGKRHYCLPDGSKVPSVTTILDKTKPAEAREALAKWRKAVGEQKAQQITTEAANRGTRMHAYLESYVLSGDMKDLPSNPYAHPSWFMAAEVILKGLVNVEEFWGVEVPLYYSGLYAGTTDCIGVWKGRPAILDFKQTNKPGSIVAFGESSVFVECGEGVLEVFEMQKPGGKKVTAKSCLQSLNLGAQAFRFGAKE